MSLYTTITTCFRDRECLLKALCDVGFKKEHLEIHEKPASLFGYQGDERKQLAEIIIRRNNIGSASNDLGFARNKEGLYELVVSDYDRTSKKYNQQWLDKLNLQYTIHAGIKKIRSFGHVVQNVRNVGPQRIVIEGYY